ncbi:E3 ubiquitin-protein ligase HTD1 [Perkinsus olseni]|uniref:E3 ubiquitin-protein ligase HTD1 n=1 Tax=Perkinsus olseni TaxID=32597 RepID=A0A7J6NSL6_PEROL|nr:E3 ubiquitin-protein ligase HTD1 [Perkinsus olseni]
MCIFGLSQLLDIEKLSKLLSEHMTRLCREEPRNCALVLLRANFYSSCEARELCDEAEVVLKTNFEGCLFGSQPPRLLEFTQLPTSLISRILQENDLRKHPSPRGEWIVLKTCTNVLRQKQWDRPELVMTVQVMENPTTLSSLENVTTTIRSLEGVLSDSEVVEGVATARYETPPSSTDSTFAVVLPAPEDGMRVWVEIEWNGVNSEGRSITFTETIPANADVGVSSAFPVDISLESGALVRLVSVEKEIGQSPSSIRDCREVDSYGEVSMFEALYACVGWSSLSLKELQSAVESPLWRAAQPRVLAHMRRLIADQEHTAASVAKSDVAVQADLVDETRNNSKRKVDEAQVSGGSTSSSYKKARFFYAAAHGKRLRATKASPISFLHTRDFGAFGTLAWLGSRAQTEWKDPFSDLAEIRATTSGTANYRDLAGAIGREKRFFEADEYFRLDEGHPSWIQIDLGEERELKITGYCLRSSIAAGEFLMNWYMFGSVNGELWDVLDKHSNCKELLGDGRTGYFPVDGVEGGYRYFRLMQFGKNSSGTDVLTCAGIDFYGEAISGLW